MAVQDQVNAILRQQGGLSRIERDLLGSPVDVYGSTVTTPGMNETYGVLLKSGTQAFHKPFSGVHVDNAKGYGHHPDQVPVNECAAWRLAAALGPPLALRVAPCVMWNPGGAPGSLSRRARGETGTMEPFMIALDQCRQAAFFDALIGQQDRHASNLRWVKRAPRLTLYDHGYSFPRPGDYAKSAIFVNWRWGQGAETLEDWERAALTRLVTDSELLGLREILLPERAAALQSRAQRMLDAGAILGRGDF